MLIDFTPVCGIRLEVPEGIYEPAEDSFLLLESALERCKGMKGKALEIGTGSGLIACALAKAGIAVDATDTDCKAVSSAEKNAKLNGLKINVWKSDLFDAVKGKYKYVIFNPPYVQRHCNGVHDATLDGGMRGREIIDRFLEALGGHLARNGFALLLQSSLNSVEKTERMCKALRLQAEIVAREKLFFEELVVFHLKKEN